MSIRFCITVTSLAVAQGFFTANVVDYGAVGDGRTVNTAAFRKASGDVAMHDGGLLVVPLGEFVTGAFNLTSNSILNIRGKIIGAADLTQYPVIPPLPSYGVSRDVGVNRYQALIMTYEAVNVSIGGGGVVDGNGAYWWELHSKKELENGRPRLMEFYGTVGVVVADVVLVNSGFWNVHPVYSRDFVMRNVTVKAPAGSPNTDGVDPDSSVNVLVEHCDIDCGDDVVAVKSGIDEYGRAVGKPCKNITIRHNIFRSGHGISIGSEVSGGIEDVYIYNNTIIGPLQSGAKIKTAPSRGGYIKNVYFTDNTFGVVSEVITLQTNYASGPPSPQLTQIEGLYYERLSRIPSVTHKVKPGVWDCFTQRPCTFINITDVHLEPVSGTWSCAHMNDATVSDVMPAGLSQCVKE